MVQHSDDNKEKLWICTDEAEDVVGSIRHIEQCMSFVSQDEQNWKWICLALHSALQGACVCHLVTTAVPVGIVTKKNTRQWLEYFEESRSNPHAEPPKTHIMSLPDLLKATRKPYSAGDRSNTAGIRINDRELAWLTRFHHEIRNEFVHFSPKGWSIEASGIPALGKLIARVIQEILDAGWAFRQKSREWRSTLERDLTQLTALEVHGHNHHTA